MPLWQIIIIIFVSVAFVGVVIGVIIKRLVFDKKKKEEYLEYQMEQGLVSISGNSANDTKKPLPGFAVGSSKESEQKSRNWRDGGKDDQRKMNSYENFGIRSTSKPEQTIVNMVEKMKRSNSHGDVGSSRARGKSETELKQAMIGEEEILTPASRAPRVQKSTEKPRQKQGTEIVTPTSRAPKKKPTDEAPSARKKSERHSRKPRTEGDKPKKRKTRDVNGNDVKKTQ